MADDYEQSQRHLVTQLIPERMGGGGQARAYQLTADSVHPTRFGRDEYGQVTEETVPICKWREFVTPSGCLNKIPMRTAPGNEPNPDAQLIEQYTLRRLIVSGFLPVSECPYTTEYKAFVHGPLVAAKNGETDCGGKPGGCEHLHNVMKMRRERAHGLWQAEQNRLSKMKVDEVATLAAAIGQAISSNDSGASLKHARQQGRQARPEE